MKYFSLSLLLFSISGFLSLQAADPADNQIKGALIDIQKYEQQFGSVTSANPSSVKRSLKLLTLTRQRLDGSPNKGHASWKEADQRYNNLVAHMNQLISPGGSTQAAPPPPSATTARATVSNSSTSSAPKQMISQYRVRIKKITRDIESSFQTMDQNGVKPFQDAEYVKDRVQRAATFQASIDKYAEFKDDPDVVAAAQKLAEFTNMIAFGKDHAAKELAELGDVQARLKTINAEIRNLKQPATPEEPFAEGQLNQWLVQLANVRQSAAKIYEPLPPIKQRAYLPEDRLTVEQGGTYDIKDVDRLERSLIDLVNSIDQTLTTFTRNLEAKTNGVSDQLGFFDRLDPSDPNDQSNNFLSEGRADEVRAMLNGFLVTAQEGTSYSKSLKHENYNDRAALVTKVQTTINSYEANYQKAREMVRMPQAATKDSKLTQIAKETLAGYDYVGNIERMVINSDKVKRSEETSEMDFDDADVSLSGTITLSGTKTTYFYEWEQFQVATAEPVGNKYFIFYNTLKYFTSGASRTPLNQWIVSGRLQGSEIPQENIDKN